MSHYTRPHEPSEYGGGGGRGGGANYYDPSADFSHAISHANHNRRAEGHGQHGGDSDDEEESSFFSKAVGFISEHKDSLKNEDVDEDRAVGAHQDLYGEGGGKQSHNADSLGGGAAVQALKMFTGGEKGHGDAQGGGGGEHDQNKFIGMAMAQAGKLWNQQNKEGRAGTDKQSAVNSAAKHALQMYTKGNHGASGTGGMGGLASKLASGGGGGGASQLFSAAKKFM